MVIKNEREYKKALSIIEPMFGSGGPTLGTFEGDYFIAVCDAIAAYEEIHYPIWEDDGGTVKKTG
jgi:antitoxin component HigA of HigAB toxin-antitoxin module